MGDLASSVPLDPIDASCTLQGRWRGNFGDAKVRSGSPDSACLSCQNTDTLPTPNCHHHSISLPLKDGIGMCDYNNKTHDPSLGVSHEDSDTDEVPVSTTITSVSANSVKTSMPGGGLISVKKLDFSFAKNILANRGAGKLGFPNSRGAIPRTRLDECNASNVGLSGDSAVSQTAGKGAIIVTREESCNASNEGRSRNFAVPQAAGRPCNRLAVLAALPAWDQ